MSAVCVRTYAKLNLTLNITGKAGGYHLLDSFVASVDIFDEITLRARTDGKISVRMCGMGSEAILPADNAAVRAAQAFCRRFGTGGADIVVQKNIPMGAGMGGSSADAAGVLNGMSALYGKGEYAELRSLADGLGSDTGYMLRGGFARMRGRGEKLESIPGGMTLAFLLLFPGVPVSTAACYAAYDASPDGRREDTENCLRAFMAGDVAATGKSFYNALFAPACRLVPAVARAAQAARALSPLGWGMTGSGSAVFALFVSRAEAEEAARRCRGEFSAVAACSVPMSAGI